MNEILNTDARSVKATPNMPMYDVAVIGGGVNGTAIARDAAGRGYSVVLLERGDLAAATSSASSKLVHGGLRYLEYGAFGLVKKALAEREVFLKNAPHIVWPLRFVLPVDETLRKTWKIKLGLKLYDRLAHRDVLPGTEHVVNPEHDFSKPLFGNSSGFFAYSDCWVDDARLVVLQAVDAARNGAEIWPRTGVRDLTPVDGGWDVETDTDRRIGARMVINAGGPWVRQLLEKNALLQPAMPQLRLVRGSHIVVPALYEGDQAYVLQQPDKRIVFALPYEGKWTLVGTTDADHDGGPDVPPVCTPDEAAYLCGAINRYFTRQTTPENIVWSYSGVRSLLDDGKKAASGVTRDYRLHATRHNGQPLLSVYGGKITTARLLAEDALRDVESVLGPRARSWTRNAPLPGGDMVDADFPEFLADMAARYAWFEGDDLLRYARAYGTWAMRVLGGATQMSHLGHHFGGGLYEAEVEYLRAVEWARTADDILWRRSKLGLHVDARVRDSLARYMGGA